MNPLLSFTSGIIAAFTPCVIVLIPLVLYKFFIKEKKQIKEFVFLIIGFLVTYTIISIIITTLFTSIIQNGIKLGLGLLFLTLGILSLINKINPLNFTLIKNSFLLGGVFALLISLNPCSLPYLGLIISINNRTKIFISILSFGIGLLTPSILFAILGQKIINFANKNQQIFYTINKLMSLLLIGSGIYLMFSIKSIGLSDVYTSLILLIFIFFLILKSFFIINKKSDLKKIPNILLLISLILIITATIWQCDNTIKNSKEDEYFIYNNYQTLTQEPETCSLNSKDCKICKKCIFIFSTSFILGLTSIFLVYLEKKRLTKIKTE